MNSDFLKKNFVTILMVVATVVLAGVAIFTALRLYQLRSQPVAPTAPESTPGAQENPVGLRPKSGNWNQPEGFVITNRTDEPINIVWYVDCWDENVCEDSKGEETLAAEESIEKGLGVICSRWQLDVNWSGTASENNDIWDDGAVAEIGPDCDGIGDQGPTTTAQPSTQQQVTQSSTTYDTQACTALNFTLEEETFSCDSACSTTSQCQAANSDYVCYTASNTCRLSTNLTSDTCEELEETPTPSPSSSPTASPTASPTSSPTSGPTSTPTATSSPIAQATTTSQPTLPDAGIAAPTVFGVGAGIILLIGAIVLAL